MIHNEDDGREHLNLDLHDPTDHQTLPARWWESGLNYATHRLSVKDQNSYTIRLFAKAAFVGSLLSVPVLILPPLIGDVRMLPIVVLAGVFAGVYALLSGATEVWKAPLIPVGFIGAWLLCLWSNSTYGLFWVATCLALLLAQQVALHFAFLRCAPPIDADTADEIQSRAERMNFDFLFWLQALLIPGLAIVILPRMVLVLESTTMSLWAHPLAALILSLYLLLLPFVFALLRKQRCSPTEMFVGTWKAIRLYINYARMRTDAQTERYEQTVGTFQSPAGVFRLRATTMTVAVIALAVTLLPLVDYFPTGKVPPAPYDFYAWFSVRPDYDPQVSELSENEQAAIHRLRGAPHYSSRAELVATLQRWGHDDAEQLLAKVIPVRAYPGNWLMHALLGSGDNTATLYNIATSVVLSIIVPPILFCLICFALAGNLNGQVYALTKSAFDAHEGSSPTPDSRANESSATPEQLALANQTEDRWNNLVARLQRQQPDYIYAGRIKGLDSPFLVHLDHFRQHVHYLGGSGRGKTALALAPLIAQLIRRGDCNVLIFDLKDDPTDRSFFQNAKIESEKTGHDFKFFTSTVQAPTHLCNPFLEGDGVYLDVEQRASQLAEALGLVHGKKYGESYYTEASIRVCRMLFSKLVDDSGYRLKTPVTFRRMHEAIRRVKAEARSDQKLIEDAGHLESTVEKYAYLPTINFLPEQTDPELVRGSIRFEDLYNADLPPQVYFFGFNAENDPERSGGLTRIFLNRLMKSGSTQSEKPRETFVIIDEFQVAAAPQFTRLLEQARSAKVGLIMANQSVPAIRAAGGEALEAALFDNVAYRQVFQVEAVDELRRFETLAGKYVRERVSKTVSRSASTGFATSVSETSAESEESRFDLTRWRVMNANRQESVAFATINVGLTRYNGLPVLIESDFHISRDEMDRRAREAAPELTPQTTTALEFGQAVQQQTSASSADSSKIKLPTRFGSDDPEE
jgi:hypothetical protein